MKVPSPKTKSTSGELSKYENPTWSELYRRLKRITPYLWPKNDRWLQFLAVRRLSASFLSITHFFLQFLCILVLIVGRFVMLGLPVTLGKLLKLFETQYTGDHPPSHPKSFWPLLLIYVGLRFLQGSGGLAALRDV